MIWNTNKREEFQSAEADIYDKIGTFIGIKNFFIEDNLSLINNWIKDKETTIDEIGFINIKCNDFQHNKQVVIGHKNILSNGDIHRAINKKNILKILYLFCCSTLYRGNLVERPRPVFIPSRRLAR